MSLFSEKFSIAFGSVGGGALGIAIPAILIILTIYWITERSTDRGIQREIEKEMREKNKK